MDRSSTPLMIRSTTSSWLGRNSISSLLPWPVPTSSKQCFPLPPLLPAPFQLPRDAALSLFASFPLLPLNPPSLLPTKCGFSITPPHTFIDYFTVFFVANLRRTDLRTFKDNIKVKQITVMDKTTFVGALPSGSQDSPLTRREDSTPILEVVSARKECRNVPWLEWSGTHDAAFLCFFSEYWALACRISLRYRPQSLYKGSWLLKKKSEIIKWKLTLVIGNLR